MEQLSEETRRAIDDLQARTGYTINQRNGQRKFTDPQFDGQPPPNKGTEVYIARLPRDLYEDELIPPFEEIGEIYEARLMMDFSGSTRGFAFVKFFTSDNAMRAVQELNGLEIRPGCKIGVKLSYDNRSLFVGGIPKEKRKDQILDMMRNLSEGVIDVMIFSSLYDPNRHRGFCFVEYKNHQAAALARRRLLPAHIEVWGRILQVDWARPEYEPSREIMSKVTALFVRNLNLAVADDDLKNLLSLDGRFNITRFKRNRDYAFVHFGSRSQAQEVFEAWITDRIDMSGMAKPNTRVEVSWAKPPRFVIENEFRAKNHRVSHTAGQVLPLPPPHGTLSPFTSIIPNLLLSTSPAYPNSPHLPLAAKYDAFPFHNSPLFYPAHLSPLKFAPFFYHQDLHGVYSNA